MQYRRYVFGSVLAAAITSVFYFASLTTSPVDNITESNKAVESSAADAGTETGQPLQLFSADAGDSAANSITGDTANSAADDTTKSTADSITNNTAESATKRASDIITDSTEGAGSVSIMAENGTRSDAHSQNPKKAEDQAGSASKSMKQANSNSSTVSRGTARASDVYLMKGDENSKVIKLQKDLKTLGYFTVTPTGYYGDITYEAVKKLQAAHNLKQDGIVHTSTLKLIEKLVKEKEEADKAAAKQAQSDKASKPAEVAKPSETANSGKKAEDYMMPWFGGVESFFARGETATVYDIKSGKSFKIKRTYGTNHADCETLTAEDTKIMKQIYGGQWSWERRPVIVTVNGKKIAASMAGMPHAGVDSEPANAYVSKRSGDYGAGTNLDTVKGNGMDGHFDIHFLNSKTHGTGKVNADHQNAVKEAARWAASNY